MVPAVLLLVLLVVTKAAAVTASRAPPRLHPSRPCQLTKQCSGVAADDAPKTENKGLAPERAHPLAILKNPHTYAEARQEPTASRTDFTPVRPCTTRKYRVLGNFSTKDPFERQKMTATALFVAVLVAPLCRRRGLLVTAGGALVSASIAGTAGLSNLLVGAAGSIN